MAERGALTIMCGGRPAPFAAIEPTLERMGTTVALMGPSGAGAATKIVNNVLMATNLAVAMEALLLAVKAGLDLRALFAVVRTASGASRAWERNVPRILSGEYGTDGSTGLVAKDQELAHGMARELGVEMPVFETSLGFWRAAAGAGISEEDPSHAVTVLEERSGVAASGWDRRRAAAREA